MVRKLRFLLLLTIPVAIAGLMLSCRKTNNPPKFTQLSRQPVIKPDYTSTMIPPNIAPLNFTVQENGQKYLARIYGANENKPITVTSNTGKITIPPRKWNKLLQANRGKSLSFDIYVRQDGQWNRFEKITNRISNDKIDPYLVYRFMKPIYNWWYGIGIYQRNLENFDTREIFHGRSFGNGCINCHSFLNNKPAKMTVGIRSTEYGSSTLLAIDEKVEKIDAKWGYTSWHPSGKLAVYSVNKVKQFFHSNRLEQRDVVDLDSALAYYTVDTQEAKTIPAFSDIDRLETYPTWTPDGKYLYFCSAPILWTNRKTAPPANFDKVRYDLRRISYDVQTNQWGTPETVLSAKETQKSILIPRITPDGRFLVFSMCDYGCFPIYNPDSDLYIMNLQNAQYHKMPINSPYSESWHSFSTNSRWMAFSSKKLGGLFTRTYFCYIDEAGKVYKPFILPQKDAAYYDSLMHTYSVPELISEPIKADASDFARAVRSEEKIKVNMPLTGATEKVDPTVPWQQERE